MNAFHKRCEAHCSFRVCFLAFLWISCLLLGIYVASNDPNILSLMHIVPNCDVSIVGLGIVLILPVLFSIVGLLYQRSGVMYFIAAAKAFMSGYILYGVVYCYAGAGWLVRFLLLFSDNGATVLFLWMLFSHINGRKNTFWTDAAVCLFAAILIGITDYLFVSPFLRSLTG